MAYVTIFLVVIGMVGGTLSFSARGSLPGEVLYPYKIQVNERIEDFVAHTNEAQARWNLATLQERLDEARTLAKRGEFDAGAQAQVTDSIQTHVQTLTKLIETLQKDGAHMEASLLASNIYQTLSTEAQMVADASSLGSASLQISLAPVLTRLRTTTATAALLATKANAKAAEETPAQESSETISNVETATPAAPQAGYFQ